MINITARKNFARRLRALRSLRYESAQDFAKILGIDGQRYRKWEQGRAEPSIYFLLRICQLLETTPTFLLMGAHSSNDIPNGATNQPPAKMGQKRNT